VNSSASLAEELKALLSEVRVLPRRLSLDTPGVRATVPMLRGVWGAALRALDPVAYRVVFEGIGPVHDRTPAYVLRPAPPDPADAPAVEWIGLGGAREHDLSLLRAWDVASGMGLGPARRRFRIRSIRLAGPTGALLPENAEASGWPVSEAAWLPGADPGAVPCRLCCPAPLRLIRRGVLVAAPTLADITAAAARRLGALLASFARPRLADLQPRLLEVARDIPAEHWHGGPLDLIRYSGRQKAELEFRGVAGHLDLPAGAGALWPLLAAMQWLHVGKGTVVGMGQLTAAPLGP